MLDFANVKGITLGGSEVKKIQRGSDVLWQKQQPAPPSYDPVFANNTWDQIIDACQKNAVPATWEIGDMKSLDLETEGIVNMQIAGKLVDDKADGTGKAQLSLISKELLATTHRMNPGRSGSSGAWDEGTGTIGGWEKSEMRTYLKETIKPIIPSAVRSAIVEVTKTQTAYDTAGSSFTQTTQDDVWLPEWNEIRRSSAKYGTLFPDNASRIKYEVGASSASSWWTRQAYNSEYFNYITSVGSDNSRAADTNYGVALGFCL